jgi:hypothetical protein
VEAIQISIYSHRPEVHNAITLVPGSLQRSLDAARFLKSQGLRVIFANVLMVQNLQDYQGVRAALAEELGVECTLDPTITPMMDGDRSVLSLGLKQEALRQVFRDKELVGDVDEFCAVAAPADENELSALPCSAGHTNCYVSPYGDAVSAPDWKCKEQALRRHLAAFGANERSALDSPKGSDDLHLMLARRKLLAVSGAGVYGGQYARAIIAGLRKVLCPYRNSVG